MSPMQRIKDALHRLSQGPAEGTEDWIRDWEKQRIFRLEAPHAADAEVPEGYEVALAEATLPDPVKDALDAPPEIERAVCVDDPRCCLFVRTDGQVFPCRAQAESGAEPIGALSEGFEALWSKPQAEAYRSVFGERTRTRDRVFFSYIGGSRTLYLRSLRLAAEEMPAPPEPCRSCPHLMAR